MKFNPYEPKYGDVIRSRQGSIYHYGIYVSESEVIQFGYPPSLRYKDKDDIKVVSTDIETFANGFNLECGEPQDKEKHTIFSRDKIVSNARNSLGETGYNVIHNNCEHFVYKCAFGIKYSEQEEQLRSRWKNIPYLRVYFADINEESKDTFLCKERNDELDNITSPLLLKQKKLSFTLLLKAAMEHLSYSEDSLKFEKNKNGYWSTPNFYFSISHNDDYVCVCISNSKVGVDIEKEDALEKYDEKTLEKMKKKFFTKKELSKENDLLPVWIKKEAIFKMEGVGKFRPDKIETSNYPVSIFTFKGAYKLAIASDNIGMAKFYCLYDGKIQECNEVEK